MAAATAVPAGLSNEARKVVEKKLRQDRLNRSY